MAFAVSMNIIWSANPLLLSLLFQHSEIDEFEVVYWKSIFMNIANLFLVRYYYLIIPGSGSKEELPADVIDLPSSWRKLCVLRAVFGSLALWAFFSSVKYTSISKANILFFTGPLYVPFLAYFFIGEQISKIDVLALLMGFIGIIMINNPFSEYDSSNSELFGGFIAALGGIFASFAWVVIRKMGGKVHFTVPPFYFSLGWTITSSILMILNKQGQTFKPKYDFYTIIIITIVSLSTFIGQIFQSLAYQYEKASRVAIFYYLQTALVFFSDYLMFSTTFGYFEIIGTVLIIGCNFTIALLKFLGYLEG